MERSFMEILGATTPTFGGAARVKDVVSALTPPPSSPGAQALVKPEEKRESAKSVAVSMIPGVIGAGLGALAFRRKHWVLGALGGHALAATAQPLLSGKGRKRALCQLAVEGAGIGGALLWEEHRIWGWMAGVVVGLAATAALVEDSASRDLYNWFKKKVT